MPLSPLATNDPNRSYEVDVVQHHIKVRNKYLYMVRWATPFEDPEHDCYIDDRAFERPMGSRIPPALARYWVNIPASDRPAAYRQLTSEAVALPEPPSNAGQSATKRPQHRRKQPKATAEGGIELIPQSTMKRRKTTNK
jgi:hypothetical protein